MSTIALKTGSVRQNVDLRDDDHRTTLVSIAGGTSGIATANQRSPTRTLGAFVPTENPCFRTFRDIRQRELLVGVKAPLLSQPVAFDGSGTYGTTASIRPLYLPLAERPESSPSINGHRYERWERSFRPTSPAFGRSGTSDGRSCRSE